jgi:hypothetical protein
MRRRTVYAKAWLAELELTGGSVAAANLAADKAVARDADERAIAEGRLTPAELERKNLFLDPARTIVHWDRTKPL